VSDADYEWIEDDPLADVSSLRLRYRCGRCGSNGFECVQHVVRPRTHKEVRRDPSSQDDEGSAACEEWIHHGLEVLQAGSATCRYCAKPLGLLTCERCRQPIMPFQPAVRRAGVITHEGRCDYACFLGASHKGSCQGHLIYPYMLSREERQAAPRARILTVQDRLASSEVDTRVCPIDAYSVHECVPSRGWVRRCLYCCEEFSDADPFPSGLLESEATLGSDLCVTCRLLAFQILLQYSHEGQPVKEAFPSDARYLSETLRLLCQVLEQVVSSDYLRHAVKALQAGHAKGKAIIAALVPIQPTEVYNRVFGSWLQALRESGLVDAGARRATYGVRCLAEDGHQCESLAEKNIDDWLFRRHISHERAPQYPSAQAQSKRLKADWAIGGALVEYWGREGNEDYDAKMKTKRAIARSAGVRLIEIGPEDLWNPDRSLSQKLAEWLEGCGPES
jgi:hypothetical protein